MMRRKVVGVFAASVAAAAGVAGLDRGDSPATPPGVVADKWEPISETSGVTVR